MATTRRSASSSSSFSSSDGASSSSSSGGVSTEMKTKVKGKPVSGKIWKNLSVKKRSALKMYRSENSRITKSWQKKEEERLKKLQVKQREQEMRDERVAKLAQLKTEREEKLKRRMANEYKTSSFQVLSNTKNIKAMSKKQLRMIKKTQVNKFGKVELVSPWQQTAGKSAKSPFDNGKKVTWSSKKKKSLY